MALRESSLHSRQIGVGYGDEAENDDDMAQLTTTGHQTNLASAPPLCWKRILRKWYLILGIIISLVGLLGVVGNVAGWTPWKRTILQSCPAFHVSETVRQNWLRRFTEQCGNNSGLANSHDAPNPTFDQPTHAHTLFEDQGFFNVTPHWHLKKQVHLHQVCQEGAVMKPCLFSYPTTCCATTNRKLFQMFYEPSYGCQFEERIGRVGDGGKWVCDPHRLSGKPCLVYSVGSNGDYSFEETVHRDIDPGCEIHTFDMHNWSHYTSRAPPEYVRYHIYTIGERPAATDLSMVVSNLGHFGRAIDVFKIDCEGCEFTSHKSWFGAGVDIRQIQVEVHGHGNGLVHEFFDLLFDKGFVVFHKEPNIENPRGNDVFAIEFALTKLP